ncbi:MAG: PLP-dependent aminotransferase family protein, partial [Candidatus Glassbacteria bacterium]|nr:PLP-dependent aminotransferase family protein [Candidatus Glassbacteria bacterium]
MDFDTLYSSAGSRLRSSKIRELMSLAGAPGIISMAGGMPDPEHFPFEDIRRIMDAWDAGKRAAALQYGSTGGYPPLLESIARYVSAAGVDTAGQVILPTTGAQQAIQLLTRVFCDPGDVVLVELPTFIGALAVFVSYGVELVGVRMDEKGLVVPELEEKLAALQAGGKRVKFLYTNPTFQNPSGITMTQSRRDELYEICRRFSLMVVEDDPYFELYFKGSPADYRSLKSRDTDNRVVLVNTFSKILSPGIRLGWMTGPAGVVSRCELTKQGMDACSSSLSQVIAADYLDCGAVKEYTARMRPIYAQKCRTMLGALEAGMPEGVSWSRPAGGFFVWVALPAGMDSEALLKESIRNKVAFVTGAPFHADGAGGDKLRLAFSNSSLEQ